MRTVIRWFRCRSTVTERLRRLGLPAAPPGPRHRRAANASGRHRARPRADWATLPTRVLPTLSAGRAGNLTPAQAYRANGGHW